MPVKRTVRSLAIRLLTAMFIVQSLCIVLAIILFPVVAPFMSYSHIADRTVRALVLQSVQKTPSGGLRLVLTPALRSYARSRPHLAFAVKTADGSILSGSSPEIAAILSKVGAFTPVRDDPLETSRPGRPGDTVSIAGYSVHGQPVTTATAGDAFGWEDVSTFARFILPAILPIYGPVFFGMFVGVPLVLRRVLDPVRRAAKTAEAIDIRSMDQRLPERDIPSEFMPLILAINSALDRLASEWSRQRLFTANAAHELRTPVTVLRARVETSPIDPALKASLTRDVRRLAILIDQLLAIARLEQRENVLEPLDLVAIVRGVVADWAPVAISNGYSLEFEGNALPVIVNGDVRAIEGAIAALIDNALKVEPSSKTIAVRVIAGASVVVRDHGPGLALEDRAMAFEPFWRKRERNAGSGLGLAAVREMARIHDGHAAIEETEGGGATVSFHIPELGQNRIDQSVSG
jgi:signal transduction histidine kinase